MKAFADAARRHGPSADLHQVVGLPLAGSVSLPRRRCSCRKAPRCSMRFTYDNSTATARNPQRPPQQRQMGTAVHRRDGRVVARGAAAASATTSARSWATTPRGRCEADISRRRDAGRTQPGRPAGAQFPGDEIPAGGAGRRSSRPVEQALRLTPDDAEAHSNLATALQRQGRTAEALREAREAVRMKPNDDRVHFNLGNMMSASDPAAVNSTEEAISELRRATAHQSRQRRRALQPRRPAGRSTAARRGGGVTAAGGRYRAAERRGASESRLGARTARQARRGHHRGAGGG